MNILEYLCKRSNSLYNQAIFYVRQNHRMTHPGNLPRVPYEQMAADLKDEPNYKQLYSQVAQQTLLSVAEAYTGYVELLRMWRAGELKSEPRQPGYRKKGGLFTLSHPAQALTFDNDEPFVRIPLGTEMNKLEDKRELFIPCPFGIRTSQIRELTIVPRNGCLYAAYSYEAKPIVTVVGDPKKALGIDHGRDNWLTCVSNVGTSFIVDGLHIKSMNQLYNKQVANIKNGLPEGFWNGRLAAITERRNRQIRDAVNKAARLVVNHCLEAGIGTIVFGWNPNQKQGSNMGKVNNQSFVQIPTGRLKDRVKQLSQRYGIQFVETEESYTSKSSFVDGDELPKYGEKPDSYKPSGRRVKRGVYRTDNKNWYINADCNAAANILKKVSAMLGLELSGVTRSALTAPIRLRLWHVSTQKPLHCATV